MLCRGPAPRSAADGIRGLRQTTILICRRWVCRRWHSGSAADHYPDLPQMAELVCRRCWSTSAADPTKGVNKINKKQN